MKFKFTLAAVACALAFLSAGCYTEFATHDTSDRGYAGDDNDEYVTQSDNDSTDSGASSDEYFGDDAYRYSRFHTSFGYYYPHPWATMSIGIGYDPWFDDPWYWNDGWRPYVLWPYPTWYPWNYGPYYGHHYWGYYSDPWYYGGGGGWYGGDGGSGLPHRTRTTGSTRGDDRFGVRSRSPLATPAGSYASPGAGTNQTGVRTRGGRTDEQRGVTSPATPTTTTRTRNNDTPWWERLNQDQKRTHQAEQPASGTQPERRRRQAEQSGSGTSVQPAQPRPATTPGTVNNPPRRRERSQSTERSGGRQPQPRYSPPSNNGGGGGRERSSGGGAPSGRSSSGGSSSNGGSRTRSGR